MRGPSPSCGRAGSVAAREIAVPAELAHHVLVSLLRDLNRGMRETGGIPRPGLLAFMRELQAATEQPPMADIGHAETPAGSVDPVMVTVAQVAHDTGYSARHLRRLAAAGRIRAHRLHARGWLIDPTSLTTYRQGATP